MKPKSTMQEAFEKAKQRAKVNDVGNSPVSKVEMPKQEPAPVQLLDEVVPDWKAGVKQTYKLERNQQTFVSGNRDRRRQRQRRLQENQRAVTDGAGQFQTATVLTKKERKKAVPKSSKAPSRIRPALEYQLLESVYGGIKNARQKRKSETHKEVKKPVCIVPNPFERATQFDVSNEHLNRILIFGDGKQWESESRQTDSDMEIVIGLDFGTSSTKVVLQDMGRHSYAVPFTDATDNPYLLPARLYEHGGQYSLSDGEVVLRNIKLRLMNKAVEPSVLVAAVAYLALVIRHCRGWLWHEHRDVYARDAITWGLNLGLPAASYENDWLVERFLAVAIASLELADDSCVDITAEAAGRSVSWAQHETKRLKNEGGNLIETVTNEYFVGVFPEIAAQIHGFVRSARWDSSSKPMMMMVDVGAGTVDASIFTVTRPDRGTRHFNFLGNNVEPNGAMNLHQERISWLERVIKDNGQWTDELERYFREINVPTDWLRPIPDNLQDYIPGMMLTTAPGHNVDSAFYNKRYWYQLYIETMAPVKKDKVPGSPQWKRLPFFLCGGGRNIPLYRSFVEKFNGAAQLSMGLENMELSKPENMEAKGLKKAEFHRLSVAYGLSYEDVGSCLKPSEIPDMSVSISDWKTRYVSKDIAD